MSIERPTIAEEIKKEVDGYLDVMTKLVVDVEKGILAIGCEYHIDCYRDLIAHGSDPKNLWGANVYPDKKIDYIALVNIRPVRENRSMEVESQEIKRKMESIIKRLLLL
jgi:hypothetical protein